MSLVLSITTTSVDCSDLPHSMSNMDITPCRFGTSDQSLETIPIAVEFRYGATYERPCRCGTDLFASVAA